jgi:leucyl-tRNA synthetase
MSCTGRRPSPGGSGNLSSSFLGPYAPHLAEELWEKLGHPPSLARVFWPEWNEELTREEEVTVVCQINGKIRDRLETPAGLPKTELEKLALASERIQQLIEGREIVKIIVVPDKLVNIVVKG